MAWTCDGHTNEQLVKNLKKNGIIKSDGVFDAMMKVDRADFVQKAAYGDHPVSIGYAATISAPHMHAHALEYLAPYLSEGAFVMDIGSGSGYLLACLAHIVGARGRVVGVEHIKELVDLSKQNLEKNHKHMMQQRRIIVLGGDGRKGAAEFGPYDCIHIGAAVDDEEVLHTLLQQLKENGALIGPFGKEVGKRYDGKTKLLPAVEGEEAGEEPRKRSRRSSDQVYVKFLRGADDIIQKEVLFGVRYIPLTDEKTQRGTSTV